MGSHPDYDAQGWGFVVDTFGLQSIDCPDKGTITITIASHNCKTIRKMKREPTFQHLFQRTLKRDSQVVQDQKLPTELEAKHGA